MRQKRFKPDQILAVLRQAADGADRTALCREHGVSVRTFYRWKARYGVPEATPEQRLDRLQDENHRLKQLVAEITLDNHGLRARLEQIALLPRESPRGPARDRATTR